MAHKHNGTNARNSHDGRTRALSGLIGFITVVCLAASLIGAGLFTCTLPVTTHSLSNAFSRSDGSAFTHEEVVKAAEATRDYTVGSHDRDAVYRAILDINVAAQAEGRDVIPGAPELPDELSKMSTDEIASRFLLADDSYVLTDDALSHLDDVFTVIDTGRIVLIVLGIIALFGCIAMGMVARRRALGRTLRIAALSIVAIFLALAVWVVVDFNGFFTFLHSLFFADGTWTFSYDSLLIRMYPPEFWIGMGAVWLSTTVLACFICFILGVCIQGKKKR